jgi:thiamine-monophosphate kinase
MPGEFELIEIFFRRPAAAAGHGRDDVILGIGDDAAVLRVPPGKQLVAALDTLVEGRHFPVGTPPRSLGHRALAVNLSDLAAMGAEPAWFLLSLTIPEAQHTFLEGVSHGLLDLAQEHAVALVGGDTTAGPLSVSVQALGLVEPGTALSRRGAMPGDLLYVSGTPGDAAAGLALELGAPAAHGLTPAQQDYLRRRFLYPSPRVALGRALRGLASACIDVSDGLAADAAKLAKASGCGVHIDADRLPVSPPLAAQHGDAAMRIALTGGDDYELCFTVPAARAAEVPARLANVKCPVTCIGVIDGSGGLRASSNALPVGFELGGYDHFRAQE